MDSCSPPKAKRLIGALTLGLLSLLAVSCGNGQPGGVADMADHGHADDRDPCTTPNAGCDCDEPSRVVECGSVQRQSGGQTWCSVGHRTCSDDGSWGECEVEGLRILPAPSAGQSTQALGMASACIGNPCDPFCQQVVDSGADLTGLPTGIQGTPTGGITLVSKDTDLNDTTCTSIKVTPAEQTFNVSTLSGGTNGLLGEYYQQRFGNLEVPAAAVPTATRVDPQVNFTWLAEPVAGMTGDTFTVRWTGFIRPTVTRSYQVCTVSDDGVRAWLGNSATPIIDNWTDHGAGTPDCGTATTLTAGTLYKIRVELYENGGESDAKLMWKHADAPTGELIPNSALLPPGRENQPLDFAVMPSTVQFSASAFPVGCFDGPVRAAWAIDRQDRANIDDTGKVTLVAPLGGDVTATAYAGPYSATGVVHVNVNVLDDTQAPAGAVTKFQNSPLGTGPEPMKVRYPYVDTVFPLALRAPTIQWDNGGTTADAVKISLNATLAGSSFAWAKVLPDANPGRYSIPQDVWAQFESSAKGKPASYTIQRITGGVVRPGVTRAITFASAPVRGKIYYTQYARDTSVSATNMMVADPGSAATAKPVFTTDAGGNPNTRKCPVCHTVSANGNMFATSDKSFSANGGLSKINPNGTFTLLSDYSNAAAYQTGQDDWRGFAWAPLTPDGTYALAANNIYGNTNEDVVGIDTATRKVSVPGTFLSGGSGTGLAAKYYMNDTSTGWNWRRTDAKVDFNWGAASPGGPVPTMFSTVWDGQVQALTSETYTFSVQTSGGVKLVVDGAVLINKLTNTAANQTYTGTAALTRGVKTPILLEFRDEGANAGVHLSWSSPSIAAQIIPQTQLYPNDGWHGLVATYYPTNDFTGTPFISNRLESNIDADWGAGGPRPRAAANDDHWTAIFDGRFEAPTTGDLQLCVYSDDDTTLLFGTVAQTLTTNCTAAFAVMQGNTYPITLKYHENTLNASLRLAWKMGTTFTEETIPRERLLPPTGWAPPTNGLTVTYYDGDNFNAGVVAGARTYASTRIEPNATLAWDDYRPEFSSNITSNDFFSARFTGRLNTTCAGIYEFKADVDDGGRLWIDGVRIVNQWAYGNSTGAVWLDTGMHDFKLDHREGDQGAYVKLSWFPHCQMGATAFTPLPTANLFPDGDAGTGGYVMEGGENGNGSNYFVWQTPTTAGAASGDVTADTLGRWGLDTTVMMVPSFAPDSSQLVFVDGDSAAGSGWRKGLSTFTFDQTNKVFKNRKSIASNWPFGDVIKWPAFESDSRSVIYQTTFPGDSCCRKTDWKKYGYMGPTNYFEDPGRLYSVDSKSATPTQVELKKLNQGERTNDKNKAYQPTMLPQAAGGYRWAVFTSTRPYGNTLNLTGQQDFSDTSNFTYISEYGKLQSMLWVSAIDDTPSANADRSHPAFFLPSQNFSEDPASGYLNERAYWVTEACHPSGTDASASCTVDEDCCDAATGTGVCRIDTPTTVPPTRHCFKKPSMCLAKGNACASNVDCCDKVCDDGLCVKPPALAKYAPANYARVYTSNCAEGTKPDWTFFDYKATVPAVGGALEFYAESSDDMATFHTLPAAPAAVNIEGVALLGTENPPGDATKFTRITMDAPLAAASVVERKYLKITIRFVPSQDGLAAPVLTDWRQSFSCPPGE